MDTIFTYIFKIFLLFLHVDVTEDDGFNLTGADSFDLLRNFFYLFFAKKKINESVAKFDD